MRGTKRLTMWMRSVFSRRAVDAALDEEMRFHLDMETEKQARLGHSPADARRRAILVFGGVERHKEAMRDGRGSRAIERAIQDLRVAGRQLRRSPGFTVAAVLTLALALGGNVAVFSVVNGVLLRPLPFPEADRIVTIAHHTRGGALPSDIPNSSATHVVYEDGSHSFESMALYSGDQASLTGDGAEPLRVEVVHATRSLFDVLRVSPRLGRSFTSAEDQPGGERVVVLGHTLWRERFASDSTMLGRAITLDGRPHTVVGVMPADFAFPTPGVQMWLPLRLDRADLGGFNINGMARLRDGVSPAAAAQELAGLLPRVSEVADFLSPEVLSEAGIRPDVHPYVDDVVGDVRPALLTLWAMVGIVLLIACINVASLLIVRTESRRREVALRVALGAERGHLFAQFMAESGVLLLVGGALGVALAWLALWLLPRLNAELLPRMDVVAIDARVLAFSLGLVMLVAILFAAIPVSRFRRTAASSVLRGGDRATTLGRRAGRVRQALVLAQMAMATVLLVGSGLMLRSFDRLRAVDPGFQPEGVMTFRIELPTARYATPADVAGFHYELLERIEALTGVRAAGATGRLPLSGFSTLVDPLRVEGVPAPAAGLPAVIEMRVATPRYFEAMGIPLREGRPLRRSDTDLPSGAVVISESVARRLLAGRQAIGARVAHGLAGVRGERAWSDVVGVVGDVRGASLEEPPLGAVYYAMVNRSGVNMDWLARSMVYAVRVDGPPTAIMPSVRRIVRELDPSLPLAEARTLASVVSVAQARMRFVMAGLTVAALVGLFIGATGIYGMLSYLTVLRTREIGVRIALGATPSSVRLAVQGQGLIVSIAGLVLGLISALVLRGAMEPMLYGIASTDPTTLVSVSAVLLVASILATWLPARRAARLDPVRALRWE